MCASVIQGRTVGAWSVVGAGTVVIHDLPDGVTAVGVPAEIIKRRDQKE
jgi:acetyltransferase EpsM